MVAVGGVFRLLYAPMGVWSAVICGPQRRLGGRRATAGPVGGRRQATARFKPAEDRAGATNGRAPLTAHVAGLGLADLLGMALAAGEGKNATVLGMGGESLLRRKAGARLPGWMTDSCFFCPYSFGSSRGSSECPSDVSSLCSSEFSSFFSPSVSSSDAGSEVLQDPRNIWRMRAASGTVPSDVELE